MAYVMTDEQTKEVNKLLNRLPEMDKDSMLDVFEVWLNERLTTEELRLLCMFFECNAASLTTTLKTYKIWNKGIKK